MKPRSLIPLLLVLSAHASAVPDRHAVGKILDICRSATTADAAARGDASAGLG
jgi:hypothetical protein